MYFHYPTSHNRQGCSILLVHYSNIILQPAIFDFKWQLWGTITNKLYLSFIGFSGIRTRIVGVEGEHADHLTTTTAQALSFFLSLFISLFLSFFLCQPVSFCFSHSLPSSLSLSILDRIPSRLYFYTLPTLHIKVLYHWTFNDKIQWILVLPISVNCINGRFIAHPKYNQNYRKWFLVLGIRIGPS